MVSVHSLSKIFELENEKIVALKDVHFEVEDGEFFTLIGPSGCGKSTLLQIIAKLKKQTTGEIVWKNSPILSFVFQNYALFPYLTVSENIEFGLKMKNEPKHKRMQIVHTLIDEMGLSGFEDKHPKEISGGMRQRVGIARSLAIHPSVLLLDEPFSSLDEFTAESLRSLLLSLWKKREITIILVTHLIREAIELSDRIAVMSKAPGTIETIIKNPLKRPRSLRSKEFFALEDKLQMLVKP